MPILTRDAILSSQDLKKELVSVPEWGGDVWVRAMTGGERDKFEASVVEQRGKKQIFHTQDIRAKLVALTVCDEDGQLLFSQPDVKALSEKSASALQRIYEVAARLSGITEEAVEELSQGLEDNPFDGSPSA